MSKRHINQITQAIDECAISMRDDSKRRIILFLNLFSVLVSKQTTLHKILAVSNQINSYLDSFKRTQQRTLFFLGMGYKVDLFDPCDL